MPVKEKGYQNVIYKKLSWPVNEKGGKRNTVRNHKKTGMFIKIRYIQY